MRHIVAQGGLRKLLTAASLVLVPAMLIGVYAAVHAEFRLVQELRETTERTVETRATLTKLLALHTDAETAVRGFVITQDEQFLAPYETAIGRRSMLFETLRTDADQRVLARLPELRRMSDAKFANAAVNIASVRAGNAGDARRRIAMGQGKAIMDNIRLEIAAMDSEEASRLKTLTSRAATSRVMLERTITAILIGLALLLLAVTLIVSHTIRQRGEALNRAQRLAERQRAMFDGGVDGMLQLDGEGNILRMNPSISRMFGYTPQELIGQHNMFLMANEFSAEQSQAWLASVGAAGQDGAGRRQEFTGKRADGTTFETEVAISRVDSAEERRYVAAIRDISDRKRAEKMKTEFVSTVSHELRTPLTSISGSLGLLGAGAVGPLNDKAKRLVDIAHANCERLVRLINDILDIEKIESGNMDFDLRKMHVAPLVERTVEAMRGYAEQHGVTVKAVLPPWPQCVVGDPDRLEQLLTNLLSNAIKHAPAGSEVEVFSNHEGGMVRLEVRDRGAGIPDEFRGRIFGKFAMADASDSRAKGGTGLGLAIAREIARRHGGDVGFDDRDGGGTVFHFDVPAVGIGSSSAKTDKPTGLPSILHLDDDPDTLTVVASAFEGTAQIIPAHTVAEARQNLADMRIDGAILDVALAYESGLDVVPQLRARNDEMPIVVFTAVDESLRSHSVDRALVKSRSSIEDLVAVTMGLLGQQKRAA